MNKKRIFKSVGRKLCFILVVVFSGVLALILGVCALFLLAIIGECTGLGKDIFVLAVLFILIYKSFYVIIWGISKINERVQRKQEREYFERKTKQNNKK